MPSISQRVAVRYAEAQREKAQENREPGAQTLKDRRASDESQSAVQAAHDQASSGRSRVSSPGAARTLNRLFVRQAMELELELDITPEELAELWSHHQVLGISKLETGGESLASGAVIDVDGTPEHVDWDQPAWDSTKQAAVRKIMACFLNDAQNLPQIGRRVDRIVRQVGAVDIYFDDGSFVSATVTDPQPSTSDEAAVIERVYGAPTKAKSCGCKKASCEHRRQAAPTVDMVAAVRRGELLGAMDARKRGASDVRFWGFQVDSPFELYKLEDVPMALARPLNDFPRSSRFRDGKQAWRIAQKHAQGRPFKRKP